MCLGAWPKLGILYSSCVAQQPNSDLGRLVLRYLDHTQSDVHSQKDSYERAISSTKRLLPTQYTHKHKGRTTIHSAGFELAIPAIERLQAYDLDRTAELQLIGRKWLALYKTSLQSNMIQKHQEEKILLHVSAIVFSHLLGISVLEKLYSFDRALL
jgi:hypothetical protein